MNKQKGFILIELMFVVVIIGIIAAVVALLVSGGPETLQRGGTICKAGLVFSIDANGYQQQVIGVNGGGVPCQ
jgi:prepilin-type N-terminal cleavage/methylation domain-containing protein